MITRLIITTGLLVLSPLATNQAQVYDTSGGPAGDFVANDGTAAEGSELLNGSFEDNGGAGSNVLDNWTIFNQVGGAGDWFAQTGNSSPLNAFPVDAPSDGAFAAMQDTTGPGSHILYQDFDVPAGGAILSLDITIENQAAGFANLPTLDFGLFGNQQARVDIMDPLAPVDDVGAGVLLNMFVTLTGDPNSQAYQTVMADLTPFAGTTVRLRVAEVDTLLFLSVGVDNVVVQDSECLLVIGDGPGESPFIGLNHVFSTQLDHVVESHGVLMELLPEFVLPEPGMGLAGEFGLAGGGPTAVNTDVPQWMWDHEFSVQILLWNPQVFPSQPEGYSYGLWVRVTPDGNLITRPFGDGTGIEVWAEKGVNADGQTVVRFPFNIPGL